MSLHSPQNNVPWFQQLVCCPNFVLHLWHACFENIAYHLVFVSIFVSVTTFLDLGSIIMFCVPLSYE